MQFLRLITNWNRCLMVIAKKLCEMKSSINLKKNIIRTADTSGDCFAVFQEVPKWGIHGFVSFKKTKIEIKDKISRTNTTSTASSKKEEPNPFKMLFINDVKNQNQNTKVSKGAQKRLKQTLKIPTNERNVTFADVKGLDKPYKTKSRQGQGIFSSTLFLKPETSNTTQLECELHSEYLNPSNLSGSKSSKTDSTVSKDDKQVLRTIGSFQKSSRSSINKSKSFLEQLYYSSQYDTDSQKSTSLIEEIVDQNGEASEHKMAATKITSKNILPLQKSRNYYSLNDLETLKSELSQVLKDSQSKELSKNIIKVSNKKTFVIKSKDKEKVVEKGTNYQPKNAIQLSKKQVPTKENEKIAIDENQYFDVVDFTKKKSASPIPTTWIRCKTKSDRKSYVMRTYPTESNSSLFPNLISSTSQYSRTKNPEMEELLRILDSIKQDMHSAENVQDASGQRKSKISQSD